MLSKFNLNTDKNFDMNDFLEIMEILRGPNGCQWDKEQTHKSIRRDFLEETYEAIEAIDTDDFKLLQEELGDVLLQVVFHSQIAKEENYFEFSNVVNDICRKLIERHPHVFANVSVENSEEILTNWDKIKIETKGQKDIKENIESISKALPALMRYQKVVKKILKYNLGEFSNTCNIDIKDNVTELKIGEALANLVSVAQLNGIDAEKALADYTVKIIKDI